MTAPVVAMLAMYSNYSNSRTRRNMEIWVQHCNTHEGGNWMWTHRSLSGSPQL